MSSQDFDKEWVLETSRTTGFSVPTIQKLIEVCYFQEPQTDLESHVRNLVSSLQIPQKWYSLRINPVRVEEHPNFDINENMKANFGSVSPKILQNLYFLPIKGPLPLEKQSREIVVDKAAAESIMTGANLYVPGFLRPLPKFRNGEKFSIFSPNHIHVANGITQFSHKEIMEMKNGLGIKTTESQYKISSYRDSEYYNEGFISDHSFSPNLACNLIMEHYNESAGHIIFDVCSAPGHKTCTLSEIGYRKFSNFPQIISIDRSTKRLKALHDDIRRLGLNNISIIPKRIEKLSTYHPELLDKADLLILDPPCSALGTRPKLSITHTENDFRSFFLLQRRLIKEITPFLKTEGILMYTTCTITLLENEGIVSILLRKLGYELLDAHCLLPKVINSVALPSIQKELLTGIARDEELLKNIPGAIPQHREDLDRYLTLDKKDAAKLIRVNPMGDHSTGYFIALLQKKDK